MSENPFPSFRNYFASDRVVNVFDLVQYFHQRVNVITLLHIAVVQAECLEQIHSPV